MKELQKCLKSESGYIVQGWIKVLNKDLFHFDSIFPVIRINSELYEFEVERSWGKAYCKVGINNPDYMFSYDKELL